jgi:hypothetical protein
MRYKYDNEIRSIRAEISEFLVKDPLKSELLSFRSILFQVEELKSETTAALTGVTKEKLLAFIEAPKTCFIQIELNAQ